MAKPGRDVHIPLAEAEAVRLLGKVKPTAEMPRQGAHTAKKGKSLRQPKRASH
jgi:hypothetical protein